MVEGDRCCDHSIVTLCITTRLLVRINELCQCALGVSFIEARGKNRSFNTVVESADKKSADKNKRK